MANNLSGFAVLKILFILKNCMKLIMKSSLLKRLLGTTIVFGGLLALYIHTLLPGTVGGDAGELQYAGPILALTHPTGLPLYIFVGHIWSKVVVVGTVAYRMNLLAAFSGALACAIMFWMAHRLYNKFFLALILGLTCGFGATFWGQAVIADKYAFNTIFVALVVGLAMIWSQEFNQPHSDRLLYILSILYGVSLLHHRTMILFAFGLGFLVIYKQRWGVWHNKRRTFLCLMMVILPALIVYPIFLPWIQSRNLAPSEWQPQTINQWIEWLLDRQEAKEAFVIPGFWEQFESYVYTVFDDYTIVVVIFSLLGMMVMVRRDFGLWILFFVSFLLQGILAANWRDNDRPFTYFLPSFMIIVFAYGYGLNVVWDFLSSYAEQRRIKWKPAGSLPLVAIGIIVLLIQFDYAYPIRHADSAYGKPLGLWRTTIKTGDMGDRLASGMHKLPLNAVLLTDWEQVTILWYYQKVEHIRPDLEIVYPVEKIVNYVETDRDICVSRHIPAAPEWHPTAYDALVCLQRTPTLINTLDDLPTDIIPVGTNLFTANGEPQIQLAGYRIDSATIDAGSFVPIVLSWRALSDLDVNYSISLRVLHNDWSTTNIVQDIQNPVSGMYPTSYWVENEFVHDYHELDIPMDLSSGNYIWGVVVYQQLDDQNFLNLQDRDGGQFVYGGTFRVEED